MNPYVIPGLVKDFDRITMEEIIDKVSCFFGVPISRLYVRTRTRGVIEARFTLFWILHRKASMRLMAIGKIFKMHHTTVLHAVKSVDDRMDVYPEYREDVNDLISIIKGTKSLYMKKEKAA